MMSISIYLILLIILLLFNLVFWILIVWFRILFDCGLGKCCSSENRDDYHHQPPPRGHRNLAFEDTENLYTGRPYTISEQMESPPSYEEALKYEQFGFHESSSVHTPSPSSSPSSSTARSDLLSERRLPQLPSSPSRISDARSRSSTIGSNSILTPIQEEELEESPVTVVIDCIGVQASRLIENCDTKIDISGAEEMNGQSKC